MDSHTLKGQLRLSVSIVEWKENLKMHHDILDAILFHYDLL